MLFKLEIYADGSPAGVGLQKAVEALCALRTGWLAAFPSPSVLQRGVQY